MDTKAQIQELISLGKTEEALELLEQLTTDSVLLQSRYNGAKRQYSMGMIDFSEWSRTQAQINYAALEMMNSVKGVGGKKHDNPSIKDFESPSVNNSGENRKVFISYNHKDKAIADRVKTYLELGGLQVTIDREKMEPGQAISDFIKSNIRSNGYILSLVSENSLKSGWVGMESTASLFAEWIADKHFIPVALDEKWADNGFYIEALKDINASVKKKEAEMREAKKLGGRTTHIESQKDRLLDLKANLSHILEKLQSVLTVSITDTEFENGMKAVLNLVQKNWFQ